MRWGATHIQAQIESDELPHLPRPLPFERREFSEENLRCIEPPESERGVYAASMGECPGLSDVEAA
jgi:hypothetical protein